MVVPLFPPPYPYLQPLGEAAGELLCSKILRAFQLENRRKFWPHLRQRRSKLWIRSNIKRTLPEKCFTVHKNFFFLSLWKLKSASGSRSRHSTFLLSQRFQCATQLPNGSRLRNLAVTSHSPRRVSFKMYGNPHRLCNAGSVYCLSLGHVLEGFQDLQYTEHRAD